MFDLPYDIDCITNRDDALIERLAGPLFHALSRYHRAEVLGLDRVPERGPVLFVGNHNGGLYTGDSFLWCTALVKARGIAAMPYGLAHELPLHIPGLHQLLIRLGAVRACHENAHRLFEAGHNVLVYPGGDVDALRPWTARNEVRFGGRTGFARLALEAGVPIVPVAAAGAHSTLFILSDLRWLAERLPFSRATRLKVLPVAFSLPWGLTLGLPLPYFPFPARMRVEILEPMRFDPTGPEAADDADYVARCAEDVRGRIQKTLNELVGLRPSG